MTDEEREVRRALLWGLFFWATVAAMAFGAWRNTL